MAYLFNMNHNSCEYHHASALFIEILQLIQSFCTSLIAIETRNHARAILRIHTRSIIIAEIGEAPHIAESHGVSKQRKEEVKATSPSSALLIIRNLRCCGFQREWYLWIDRYKVSSGLIGARAAAATETARTAQNDGRYYWGAKKQRHSHRRKKHQVLINFLNNSR